MPVNENLDVNYSAAQKAIIEGALISAKTETENVIGTPLNLSDEERGDTPSVDEQRESYVIDAIVNLGNQYPNLLGPEITLARAQNLWQFRQTSKELIARAYAYIDLVEDAMINAESICLKFTEDMRGNAQRYKDRNVPGADVVWDRLKDMHTVTPNPGPGTPPVTPP